MDIRELPHIKLVLHKAGWYKNRAINIHEIQNHLLSNGFVWGDHIDSFLREFGNLSFSFKDKDSNKETFHFFPLIALSQVDKAWILENYAQRIGKKLCIVGQSHRGHITLSMAEDGSVYGGYDDFLCYMGGSGEKVIENLINQVDFTSIE